MKQPLHRLEATSLHASSAVLPGRSTFQGPQAAPPAARFGVGCTAPERHRFGGFHKGVPQWLVGLFHGKSQSKRDDPGVP